MLWFTNLDVVKNMMEQDFRKKLNLTDHFEAYWESKIIPQVISNGYNCAY